AAVGALVALGVASLTGDLGGDGTRTVAVPQALDATGAPPAPPAAGGAAPAAAGSVQEIVRTASPAVVQVEVVTDTAAQSGTGFLIDGQGTALTNAHVVADAETVEVEFQDLSTSTAEVVGSDPDIDLAVLRIAEVPSGTRPLPLGRSGGLSVGEPVVAIGNPFGFARTVTTGVVSALGRKIEAPSGNSIGIPNAIQTDAAINQGNSGGPLLDMRGRVVGINSQIYSRGGGSDGVGFAVPVDTIRPVARSIVATGRAQHAWIGITGRSLTPEAAAALGARGRTGVVVVGVDPRGPAREAGMRPGRPADAAVPRGGDLIVAIDGRAARGMDDVTAAISSRAVGERLTLTLLRDGKERTVRVTLEDRPADVGRSG
ncbi:MAG: trypsin-like peptidase domain-containing protein, partial [Actinomycetota bacterium]